MYQTIGQRRNNWRRTVCVYGPDGIHVAGILNEPPNCVYCAQHVTWSSTGSRSCRWYTAAKITLVEWP